MQARYLVITPRASAERHSAMRVQEGSCVALALDLSSTVAVAVALTLTLTLTPTLIPTLTQLL